MLFCFRNQPKNQQNQPKKEKPLNPTENTENRPKTDKKRNLKEKMKTDRKQE
jgi:hypothetical protein